MEDDTLVMKSSMRKLSGGSDINFTSKRISWYSSHKDRGRRSMLTRRD